MDRRGFVLSFHFHILYIWSLVAQYVLVCSEAAAQPDAWWRAHKASAMEVMAGGGGGVGGDAAQSIRFRYGAMKNSFHLFSISFFNLTLNICRVT